MGERRPGAWELVVQLRSDAATALARKPSWVVHGTKHGKRPPSWSHRLDTEPGP